MRVLLAALAALCLSSAVCARPYRLDDMMGLEGYGQVLLAPDGAHAVVERRGPYSTAASFDYGYYVRRLVSRVMVVDLVGRGPLRDAFPQDPGAGYWAGSYAPSGRLLTVFRLADDRLSLGVANVATGTVVWRDDFPDLPLASAAPVWLDDHRFVFLRFPSRRLPFILDFPSRVQRLQPVRWLQAREGRSASSDLAWTGAGPSTAGGDQRDLVVVDVRRGGTRRLATGAIVDFAVSPRADTIAVILKGPSVAPDPGTPVGPGYQDNRARLQMLDIASGDLVAKCSDCDLSPGTLWFSSRSRLLVRARRDGEPWSRARHFLFVRGAPPQEMSGASVPRAWLDDRLLAFRPGEGWRLDNRRLSVAPPSSTARVVATGGRRAWLSDDQRLWRIDEDGMSHAIPLPGHLRFGVDLLDPASVGFRKVSQPAAGVVVRAEVQGTGTRLLASLGRRLVSGPDVEDGVEVLAVSAGSRAAIVLQHDVHGVGSLEFWDAAGHRSVIDRVSEHLVEVDLPEMLAIPATGRDGTELIHWLLLPKVSRAKPPLVTIPYQGSVWSRHAPGSTRPDYFGSAINPLLLVAHGFAVLLPSLPQGPKGDPSSTLVRDVDAAVDAAVASDRVDGSRLALLGHSYGGVNALLLAARSNRYRGIISASGSADLAGSYGALPPVQRLELGGGVPLAAAVGWYESGQGGLGVPPWSDPKRYERSSALFEADRIRTPILLVGGDLDYVPMEQAERMYVALTRLGRDASLLRFFGEGHVIQSPANIRRQWATYLEFLDRTLGY